MKKNYLMMAAFATALAFTACSNEEEMPVVNGGNGSESLDVESVIEISVSNTGSGTTRAARPVGSSEAYNTVDHVKLVFIGSDGQVVNGVELSGNGTGYNVNSTDKTVIDFTDGKSTAC